MKIFNRSGEEGYYFLGLCFVAISAILFCLPLIMHTDNGSMQFFFCHYGLTGFYFFALLSSGKLKKGRQGLHHLFVFLILFLISAYALNRDITVFEESAPWMAVLLVIVCLNYLLFHVREKLPRRLQTGMYFILGVGFVLFIYLSFYLIPVYVMGMAAFLALGISLHTFVPLLFCIYTVVLYRRTVAGQRAFRVSFIAGMTTVAVMATVFTVYWNAVVSDINDMYKKGIVKNSGDMPAWVYVAGSVPRGRITEMILQSGLVYSVPSADRFSLWEMPHRSFGEQRIHDPLVMTAALFGGTIRFSEDERIKILEAMYDSRHLTQERLWRGKELVTDDIRTSVQVWPSLHMAYTEKLVTVTSHAAPGAWPSAQEAIYTFHLPEGSVVSSLSLWIKGQEKKAVVTTKGKAQKAYGEIVGVEAHDPSLVHWQEGNTVSVRVFPVTNGESRIFKLGVSTPLTKQKDSLVYDNVFFDGPDASHATETVNLDFESHPRDLESEASFTSESPDSYSHSGAYNPSWNIRFKDPGVSGQAFSFDGVSYAAQPYEVKREAVPFGAAYLDINAAWTRSEFDEVWNAVKDHEVWVYNRTLIRVTAQNRMDLFSSLQKAGFSLFPLYEIKDPASAVLISKSEGASPNISDLTETPFLQHTREFEQQHTQICFFNLGTYLTPYLKSLKELRSFRYEQGTPQQLSDLVAHNLFASNQEGPQKVVLDNAGLCLTASPETTPSLAPDHLMRLFTYNHLMQQAGAELFADSAFTTGLTEVAAKATIVTPVSSMIVLETQEDYDRFGISKSKNSLENASLHSQGAVPEPHEWALMLLALLTVAYVRVTSAKKKINAA